MKKFKLVVCLAAVLFVVPALASAGSLGVYCWQIWPHSDVVCFDIDSKGWVMSLTGWDHLNGEYKFAAHGAAVLDNYFGVYSFDWTSFTVNFGADIFPGTLNGTWYDSTGDYGNFNFIGSGPKLDGVVQGTGPKFKRR